MGTLAAVVRGSALAAVGAAVVLAFFPAPRPPGMPANVIVVLSDSLRARNLGTYGYGRPTSPNLDAVAGRGLVYDNAFSHYSFTWPSVSNLFSGLPYSTLRRRRLFTVPWKKRRGGLSDGVDSLAEALSSQGVTTCAVSASPYITRDLGFGQGFDRFYDWASWKRDLRRRPLGRITAEEVNAVALRMLHYLRWPKQQPFFLYLHYMDTHMKYRAPAGDLARFAPAGYGRSDRVAEGAALRPDGEWLKWRTPDLERWFTDEDTTQLVAYYDAEIRHFDRALAGLLAYLKDSGLLESTIVVITADHGEAFFERGRWGHGYLSRDEEEHVPMIILLPGADAMSGRIAFPVTTTDLFHTIRRHFGVDTPPDPDAVPQVADLFRGERRRAVAYSEGPGATRVFRDGRYSLYLYEDMEDRDLPLPAPDGEFLFDVVRDPRERKDLLAAEPPRPEAPSIRDRLLRSARAPAEPAMKGPDPMLRATGELRERLRALGYVDD